MGLEGVTQRESALGQSNASGTFTVARVVMGTTLPSGSVKSEFRLRKSQHPTQVLMIETLKQTLSPCRAVFVDVAIPAPEPLTVQPGGDATPEVHAWPNALALQLKSDRAKTALSFAETKLREFWFFKQQPDRKPEPIANDMPNPPVEMTLPLSTSPEESWGTCGSFDEQNCLDDHHLQANAGPVTQSDNYACYGSGVKSRKACFLF
jgi:hypothetical protein